MVIQFKVIDNDKFPQRQDQEDIDIANFMQNCINIAVLSVIIVAFLSMVVFIKRYIIRAGENLVELQAELYPEEEDQKIGATRIFKKFDACFKDGLAEISSSLIKKYSDSKGKEKFSLTREELIDGLYEYFIIKYSEIGITRENLENHSIKAIIERELTEKVYSNYFKLIQKRIKRRRIQRPHI